MRERNFYGRREHFPTAGMFPKCLCRNGNISFSKNNCSLRTHILSVQEYSERIFPFHMRRKFPPNPKVSLLLLIWMQWRPMLLLRYHVNFGLRLFCSYCWTNRCLVILPLKAWLCAAVAEIRTDEAFLLHARFPPWHTRLYTHLFLWDFASEQECKSFFNVTQDNAWFIAMNSYQQNPG